MWIEIIEYLEKVCKEENKNDVMSVYLSYITSLNPFKRVTRCSQYEIAKDIIEMKSILWEHGNNEQTADIIYDRAYKSEYIRKQIEKVKKNDSGVPGIKRVINENERYIEISFILKNIENYHNHERLKNIVTFFIAVFSLIVTIKVFVTINLNNI